MMNDDTMMAKRSGGKRYGIGLSHGNGNAFTGYGGIGHMLWMAWDIQIIPASHKDGSMMKFSAFTLST